MMMMIIIIREVTNPHREAQDHFVGDERFYEMGKTLLPRCISMPVFADVALVLESHTAVNRPIS